VNDLLNTVVDSEQNTTVQDELGEVAKGAVSHVKEWLRSRHIANEKIEAETLLILEQARDMYERRQSELANAALDRERKEKGVRSAFDLTYLNNIIKKDQDQTPVRCVYGGLVRLRWIEI